MREVEIVTYIALEMPWYEDDYLEDLRFFQMNMAITGSIYG